MGFKRFNISVDEQVWEDARALISEVMNLSMSKFIEIQLRTLVRSHKSPFADVVQGAMRDFIAGDKSLTAGERTKMNGLLDSEKKVKGVKKKK